MPVFQITTVNSFRNRYVIEADSIEEAYDSILIDKPEELSQIHLDESIIEGKQISKTEFQKLLKQVVYESDKQGGMDNAHMGDKIIHRVRFLDA